jgi:HD superfamily phosphohydrolase
MDADRTDYLLRDSLHCGVDYGKFDHRRMIECLALHEESNGALEIALTRDGIHTFEALILARYQMNTQVYYHRLRRIYDCYLTNYHKALGSEAFNSPEKVLAHNDVTIMAKIMEDAEEYGDEERQRWARRIRDRCHHRLIHETGANANAMELRWSQEVLQSLQKDYPDCDFIWDRASASIHKLLVPEDQDDTGRVPRMLIGRDGSRRLLGEESQVLRYIPRRFQCARIFVDISSGKDGLRREIKGERFQQADVEHAYDAMVKVGLVTP